MAEPGKMTPVKAFVVLSLAVWSSEVTSWIVDMAEVGRSLGEEQFREHPEYDEVNSLGVARENYDEVNHASNYAEEFQYTAFRTKEVDNVIKNGGVYLEALSVALAAYRAELDDCNRRTAQSGEHQPGAQTCDAAEQKARLVKTLSRTALTVADKLRDEPLGDTSQLRASGVPQIAHGVDSGLLQLARSLQQLATLTGAHPPDNSPQSTTEATADVSTEHVDKQNLEIMQQVENGRSVSRLPSTPSTDVKSVQKRDISDVTRYYVKYKVWNGTNPVHDHRSNDNHQFDVRNSLEALAIRKRSVADKKAANMQSVIQTKRLKCEPKDQSKNKSKLVKFIKVYRRKVIRNTRH